MLINFYVNQIYIIYILPTYLNYKRKIIHQFNSIDCKKEIACTMT